jgi:DnaJ family protein A protein 2
MFFGGDPFAHMHGGHGGGGRRSARSRDVDTSKLYETLGVNKHADAKDIKRAYRKAAIQHHPDKGGDEHMFKEINAAYEILSDPQKRARYDKFGLDGVGDDDGAGGGGGHSHDDLFSMFFGGSGRSRGPPRGEDVNHPLKVSLEDLYNGKTVKLAINRQVLVGEPTMCTSCDGQGIVLELRQIALGMVQQIQRKCSDCGGEGWKAQRKMERKVLEVLIEKGMRHSQKIVFRGMADEKPNMEAGNINFIVQEKEHDTFKRKGADLLITKTLSLNEALCGFEWKLTHLDGRNLVIKSKQGEVILPETEDGKPYVKIVPNEGMPSHGNPFVKGNLYVLFRVQFPKDGDLTVNMIKPLKMVLPNPSTPVEVDDHDEVVHLEASNVHSFGKGGVTNHQSTYDSDEESEGAGVQCQQS